MALLPVSSLVSPAAAAKTRARLLGPKSICGHASMEAASSQERQIVSRFDGVGCMNNGLQNLLRVQEKFGTGAACRYAIDRLGRSAVGLQVVEVVWLEPQRLKIALDVDPKYQLRF